MFLCYDIVIKYCVSLAKFYFTIFQKTSSQLTSTFTQPVCMLKLVLDEFDFP